jgi:hypothetical protein
LHLPENLREVTFVTQRLAERRRHVDDLHGIRRASVLRIVFEKNQSQSASEAERTAREMVAWARSRGCI